MQPFSHLKQICLSEAQRRELAAVVREHTGPRRLVARGQIILLADEGKRVSETARFLGVSCDTVRRWRQRWLASPIDRNATARLADAPRSGTSVSSTSESPGTIVPLAYKRPEDYRRPATPWVQPDIASQAIQAGMVSPISCSSVERLLKIDQVTAVLCPRITETKSRLYTLTACRLFVLALLLSGVSFLTWDPPIARPKPVASASHPALITQQVTQLPVVSPPSTARITLEAYTRRVARRLGVDEALALAVLVQESDPVDPLKVGKGNSQGPMQIKPIALKDMGLSPDERSVSGLVYGGVLYLKEMLTRFRSLPMALAAYNMGPGRLRQQDYQPYTGTQRYISQVLARAEAIRAGTFRLPPILQYLTHEHPPLRKMVRIDSRR